MINFAVYKHKRANLDNKGINCPDNHNLKKKTELNIDVGKYYQPDIHLDFILDDYVLPPKAIMLGECMKRN